jgi:hypothetical protein
MNKKNKVLHICSGCKQEKDIKPSKSRAWRPAIQNYEIRYSYRCNECNKESVAKWRKKNPIKHKAHRAVYTALRSGFIKKSPCEICGDKKVEAHHIDYEKPLDVIWYCKTHHHIADSLRRIEKNL